MCTHLRSSNCKGSLSSSESERAAIHASDLDCLPPQDSESLKRLWLFEIPCWKSFPANFDAAGKLFTDFPAARNAIPAKVSALSGKEDGCWKIGPAFGSAPGFSPLRPPQYPPPPVVPLLAQHREMRSGLGCPFRFGIALAVQCQETITNKSLGGKSEQVAIRFNKISFSDILTALLTFWFNYFGSAKTDLVLFKWGFGEGLLKDKFAFFEAYRSPIPKGRKPRAERPFL